MPWTETDELAYEHQELESAVRGLTAHDERAQQALYDNMTSDYRDLQEQIDALEKRVAALEKQNAEEVR